MILKNMMKDLIFFNPAAADKAEIFIFLREKVDLTKMSNLDEF